METVTVAEAKAHLSGLLNRIERGEEVIVTRRGQPVAKIVPVQTAKRRLPSLRDFRAKLPRPSVSGSDVLRRLRDESR